jgi:hypothetical protein
MKLFNLFIALFFSISLFAQDFDLNINKSNLTLDYPEFLIQRKISFLEFKEELLKDVSTLTFIEELQEKSLLIDARSNQLGFDNISNFLIDLPQGYNFTINRNSIDLNHTSIKIGDLTYKSVVPSIIEVHSDLNDNFVHITTDEFKVSKLYNTPVVYPNIPPKFDNAMILIDKDGNFKYKEYVEPTTEDMFDNMVVEEPAEVVQSFFSNKININSQNPTPINVNTETIHESKDFKILDNGKIKYIGEKDQVVQISVDLAVYTDNNVNVYYYLGKNGSLIQFSKILKKHNIISDNPFSINYIDTAKKGDEYSIYAISVGKAKQLLNCESIRFLINPL